jgi:molybdenum cofactor cytidylyltransferase
MKNIERQIGVVILAAGSSSRLGRSKQLLFVNGEPLLVKTSRAALKTNAKLIVTVLGAEAELHQTAIQHLPIETVINETWHKGMGNSIKCGLHHLLQHDQSLDAVIICVCDQPMITSQHLNALVNKFEEAGATIVASRYAGIDGVPVLFARDHFKKLLVLDDTTGARQVLLQHADKVHHVDFPDGKFDIDTQQNLDDFLKHRK